jgi:glycosyltransferase involved in cell wall biosynthesis
VKIAFVHQNFPSQFRHLAPALQAAGAELISIGASHAAGLQSVPLERYNPCCEGEPPTCHPWVTDLQTKAIRAKAVGLQLEQLRREGWVPDLLIGHSGWGELLAVKDVLPEVPVLHLVEYMYQVKGADVGFDPEFANPDWQESTRVRLRRAAQLLAINDLDWAVLATPFQASTVPKPFHDRLSVIHEGIDTAAITPLPDRVITLQKAGLRFKPGDEVVSFVNRSLEPMRGFHVFMRCLPLLQRLRPNAHVVIVGGDGVSYGPPPAQGGSWKQVLLAELEGQLDLSRVHFVGNIPHGVLHDLFRVCSCHVYLTYPFVLSWSLLEAMSCEAVVVGSDTAPLHDVIDPGRNGLLVDFFDTSAMAQRIAAVLADYAGHRHLGQAARRTVVEHYDLHSVCLPQMLQLIDTLAAGRRPAAGLTP